MKPVIGLEVHVELMTKSKAFCACSTTFGAEPNSQTCPVCLGLPGALPVLNERVVILGLRAARLLNCRINLVSTFDRKNYFYPDLPKGYQITQQRIPLAQDGWLEIDWQGRPVRVGITRLHIEEDAGKLIHTRQGTLVDYNRSGVPLVEIVTAPVFTCPAQARVFLEELHQLLRYAAISDCRMEQGSLRCDANLSLVGPEGAGVRTEIKNLNSFKAVEQALTFEFSRQVQTLAAGQGLEGVTLRWDEEAQGTVVMRAKEGKADYRYFPEPDLPPLQIDQGQIEEAEADLPELPRQKRQRFAAQYGLRDVEIAIITRTQALSDWFEEATAASGDARAVAKWLVGEISRHLNEGKSGEIPFAPQALARIIAMEKAGELSTNAAKAVIERMFAGETDPDSIICQLGLRQINDTAVLARLVAAVVAAHTDAVADYLSGKDRALGYLMGKIMEQSQGRANPNLARALLLKKLEKRKL